MWMVWVLLGLVGVVLLAAFLCFLITYYSPRRTEQGMKKDQFPPGRVYEPYHPVLRRWAAETEAMEYTPMEVTTPDGLTLRGRLYEYSPDATLEILFHGYRGFSQRDMCGAVQRCFALGHSVLLVDQRAAGRSDGQVITFGAKESRDVFLWLDAVTRRFGPERRLMLGGVSMGATTVMLAAGQGLPPNVVGVLADCGFTSAREIIRKVIRQLHLPVGLLYPFVRLGAVLFAGFDPNRVDTRPGLARCRVPMIFYHGDTDDFVACEMTRENHAVCAAPKQLVIIPGAGHGLAFPADEEGYVAALREFEATHMSTTVK